MSTIRQSLATGELIVILADSPVVVPAPANAQPLIIDLVIQRLPEVCPPCYNCLVVSESHLTKQRDEQWMALALEQARRAASLGEVPVGAVAVLDDQIIGRGFNMKELTNDPTAHAELIALKEAAEFQDNWRLVGVTLYSTLEPCPMCAGAMIQARLERLVYGARDIRFGADGSVVDVLSEPRFNHRVAVTSGILEDDAAELMRDFFRRLRQGNGSG